MKKIGKYGKINAKANKEIAKMWVDKDIRYCEVCPALADMDLLDWQCLQASSNAHRHGRIWYRSQPELLWDFNQVVRACMKAHRFIDEHQDIREEVFIKLRGEE